MDIQNAGAILLAFAIQLYSAIAIDPPGASIVGCSAVGCPTGPGNSTSANCLVAGRRSNLIGLANLKKAIVGDDDDDKLTWSETVGYSNSNTNSNTSRFSFERSFYLGAPGGFNLTASAASSNFGACAVFFTNISATAKFPGENIGTSFGTCNDAITADCANALIEQAQLAMGNHATSNSSSSCESLKDQISKEVPPSCSGFATGNGAWNGVEVKDLTGPNAPNPLTADENSTSTCYPTLPKTNSLTYVATFSGESSWQLSDQTASIFAITPILTVFFPKDGNITSSKVLAAGVDASLTCLKPIDETNASDATRRSEGPVTHSGSVSVTSKLSILGFAMLISPLMMFA